MDFKIAIENGIGQMTFEKADNIMNNVFLSLMIRKGSFFQNPDFGSRLHLLKRAKNTAKTAALAEQYCKEALQWLIDNEKAKSIEVFSGRDMQQDLHRLKLLVEVTQMDGRQVSFDTFVEVV